MMAKGIKRAGGGVPVTATAVTRTPPTTYSAIRRYLPLLPRLKRRLAAGFAVRGLAIAFLSVFLLDGLRLLRPLPLLAGAATGSTPVVPSVAELSNTGSILLSSAPVVTGAASAA